jgi:hypothetical protein
MFGFLFGRMFSSVFAAPCAILAIVAAFGGICGCIRCLRCRLRDCACVKKLLRVTGYDQFDDFELMVLVHEVAFERKESKMPTVVRLTAGLHAVKTDPNSNGIFQQPLIISVEQGTQFIVVDLLDMHDRVLATLHMDVVDHLFGARIPQPEMVYTMKQKGKGIRNPKCKLTMVVSSGDDAEQGLLSSGLNADVDILVRQQLKKAKEEGKATHRGDEEGEQPTEMEILKQACAGPLELFEGLGKTCNVYVAILGPPTSRRWIMGIWHDKRDFDSKRYAMQEIDLLKIQCVQADPTRHHVFQVQCYDESRVRKTLTFRRIDRARDVWVEILTRLVQKAHDSKKELKMQRPDKPERKTKRHLTLFHR